MWIKVFALLVVLAVVLGCGGGGGGSSEPPAPVAVSISPATVTVNTSGTQTFTATVTGSSNTAVTWSVGVGGGTITSAGVYTAGTIAGNYQVRATSVADPTKSAVAQVTVKKPSSGIGVTISPTDVTVGPEEEVHFTATVSGTSNKAVNWFTSGSAKITADGVYTSPEVGGNYTVTVKSVADPSASATARVTVTGSAVGVIVTPATATVGTNEEVQLTGTVTSSADTRLTWTTDGGTISTTGLFKAPLTPGTYTVTATSVAKPSKSATSKITVRQTRVSILPTETTVVAGNTADFRATVTGANNTKVQWSSPDGPITTAGRFTAPTTPGNYTVTATSVADPSQSATATVHVVAATNILYQFETGIPAEWAPAPSDTAPKGQKFLGQFGNSDSTTLTLTDLSPHKTLEITFDAYFIRSWDGDDGPDSFKVLVDGVEQFNHTFANFGTFTQNYPVAGSATATSATEKNSLGYKYEDDTPINDTVYRIVLTIPHTAKTVTIRFAGTLDEGIDNESWGLDNVRIRAVP